MCERNESLGVLDIESQSIFVEARCLGEAYASRKKTVLSDVKGDVLGASVIVPPIYIQRKIQQMRDSTSLSLSERYRRLELAAKIFSEKDLSGLSLRKYIETVARATGLHLKVVAESVDRITYGLENMRSIMHAATPCGAVLEVDDASVQKGRSLFSRRGDVVAVVAAGNGPGTHGLWPQAVAMGYRTLVKPSMREPLTAQRLVLAFEEAGLSDYVGLIPTDHSGVDALIAHSDFSIVYGGPDVSSRFSDNAKVLVQGPGRSKIYIGSDVDLDDAAKLVAESVVSLGGAACVSTSSVLIDGDAPEFAEKLRLNLSEYALTDSMTLGRKDEIVSYIKLLEGDSTPWMSGQDIDGACQLVPHVAVVEKASDPKVQREFPFPCVTVAPFDMGSEYEALQNSLVVTAMTRKRSHIHRIINDSTIKNVYIGEIPTTWMNYHVPHDGYLADFLMCNRGVKVDPGWLTFD